MSNMLLITLLLGLMAIAYQLGLVRSKGVAATTSGTGVKMHSRPTYHAMLVALWVGVPAALIFAVWSLFQPGIIESMVLAQLPPEMMPATENDVRILLRRIHNLSGGFGLIEEAAAYELNAARYMAELRSISQMLMIALMASVAATALVWTRKRIHPLLRARNQVEQAVRVLLVACSAVAILTTIGIVLSMIGEAMRFFSFVSPMDFFFGTTWNPRFSTVGTDGQTGFGMLPLLWGTMMIALIALAVAVPVGLMAAIFLSEYASDRVRAVAKPIIEVLAGIPTIVYGFFALITVGPFLANFGASLGLEIRATSAITAGLVMGIMIIPFISSLSDDIITQVPKSLRDGSLGLGATKSETIRKVVLPAALPGIVGAILLAASRAIGETMIVVLAAGNSPVLTANPFEAVSTMTVTIVNQLTGDLDFASPQSLVAFALGLTLFVITLLLNVVALVIVRKYREQYE
ncbi:phosphate ABC transporter permease subunit PstC [Nitrincola tapanii]|uniref:Phosphate transport system permease protein n=1 Tax=Nitrincola tapanii TaxID=1708751 RepID=A0A5A9VZR0_9GAMM|nr:phosphate ABC transporter permease subunit PstC [Nitrincola tapanii]KAA0873724.1 phosphate ABC transporter permease subunit PstC [Nitrincola tapanii]